MTVAELLDRMSSREFSEWMAYYEIEPFGEERADLRQAMTTSAVNNLLQVQAKKPKWTKPQDFMLFGKKEEKAPVPQAARPAKTPEQLMSQFEALTKSGKKGGANAS